MPLVALIRDGHPDEARALESLQRRASDVWDDDRANLAAHPDAIAPPPPHEALGEGRVRVAVDSDGRQLGFATVLPVEDGWCELDDLFVEPDVMRQGVGRLLVEDAAARAAAAGATRLGVIANPNATGFYARLGFGESGEAATRFGPAPRMMLDLTRRADAEALAGLMHAFLAAVSFAEGARPAYRDLEALVLPEGRLIRTSGDSPEISTVAEFIRTRQAAFDDGHVRWFEETELSATTVLFGNVAHRFSPYRKRAETDGTRIDVRGAISTQFVRTPAGWRISSMAWDDERPGLQLPG